MSCWRLLPLLLSLGTATQAADISGYIRDASNGESLPFVSVYLKGESRGSITNEAGYYVIPDVPAGGHELVVSYIGYAAFTHQVTLTDADLVVDVRLSSQAIELQATVIEADATDLVDIDISPSRISLRPAELKAAPAAIEADPIRTIQTLPGVAALSDFSVGLYVRGGTPDQNLVLLDGSDVYNASHLFGLFSTFPADATKSTELLRGGYPAKHGGRLSSVLNVITDEGNKEHFEGSGGASFLASRLTLQGPVSRGSWLVSGRRTHLDPLVAAASGSTDLGYYFYDLQGKTHQVLSHDDQLTIAAYTGLDELDLRNDDLDFELQWGNRTISSKWTHVFDSNLFGNFLFTGSRFKANTLFRAEDTTLEETNRLTDLSLKGDLNWLPTQEHSLELGYLVKRMSMEYVFGEKAQNWVNIDVEGFHNSLYVQDNLSLTQRLRIQPGLRFNHFSNGGYNGWSPRLAARYQLGLDTYLKAATGVYHQYIFRLAREFQGISLLSNIWALADSTAKPSRSIHYVAGFETKLRRVDIDMEVYYKDYDGLYELNYDEQESVEIGDILRRGDGRAYGFDLLLRKREGRQTGWIALNTGVTERAIDGLELDANGRPQTFRSKFDRRITLHIIHSWRFSDRWTLSSRFTEASGQPYTQVFGTGEIELPSGMRWDFQERGELNGVRLPQYERLDTSIARQFDFGGWDMKVYLQIVNLSNHKNIFNYYWTDGTAHKRKPGKRKELSMLPILPSFGLDFSF
ncbi:MAG: TonB-dependent receptor [Candidatus Latescibacterota bacterium]|nr:TonB-dependent receptor [Candidatus Latescibacterota bacterium]